MKTRGWAKIVMFLGIVSAPAFAAEEEKEITIEQFLQGLSTVPDVMSRKDPFINAAPPFEIPKKEEEGGVSLNAPVLERYPLAQYTVVATLLGDQYPRALLKLPENEKGKVLIVKLKDKLGNRGGVIAKITKEGVVVVQSMRSPLGFVDKSEVVLRVGAGGAAAVPGAPPAGGPGAPAGPGGQGSRPPPPMMR